MAATERTTEKRGAGRFLPLAALAAGLVVFFALGLHHYLSFGALAENRDFLKGFVDAHPVTAPLAFMAVYALAVAFSIPGALVLTIAGGFLFGTWLGGFFVVIGATIGAVGVFLAARTAFGEGLRRRAGPWIGRLEAGFRENALSYLLVLRLVPLFPFWLVNLVPAFLGVPLTTYALGTFVGIIPGSFVYASVGNGLGAVFDAGGTPDLRIIFQPEILLPIIGLSLLALIPVVYKKFKGKGVTMATIDTDICVIGAGSGGLSVAAGAAQMGASTVLIERGAMGGDCLNYGCVPSKSMIAAGRAADTIRHAGRFGVNGHEPQIDFGRVHDHIHGVIAAIAPNDSVERFEGLGVRVIQADARFTGPDTVEAGGTTIKARRFVLATGSRASHPPIPGLDAVPFLTNETVFERKAAPEHLIVIGGGPIGVEMAQAHRRLGADVTVLQKGSILPKDDPDLVAVVRGRLVADGVGLREEVDIAQVERHGNGIAAVLADGTRIEGSDLLVAAGRQANVDGLGLEAAGIEFSSKGVTTDARLRTTNRRVFAVGDVAGGPQFTHIAGYHAGIVIRNVLFRLPAKVDYSALPWVTYTDPELAHVGLTEAQARESHKDIRVLTWDFEENDRAQAERETEGRVKVLTLPNGRILGASIVGPHAGELIQVWCLAISQKLKIGAIASMIAPYPTLGEAGKRAAGSFYTPKLFSGRTRGLVRFLSWFG